MRVRAIKTVLWLLLGIAAPVAIRRFFVGLGASTALTDVTPWGLWIGFDVVGGVALAAGGFVIAATVHVLHRERFHPVLRPAILTAFLGYVAVAVGLLFDLGLPWNIWRPTFYWQHHSVLFEVAWCVMLYLTVLALEFAPVVFEGLRFDRAFLLFKKLTLPLVILGIMLSTLHQSSLGSLFLIMPFRLHPLWYSPLLPVLFFVSAVGLGLATVIVESMVTSWAYGKKAEAPLLGGLAHAAAYALSIYALLRLGDLVGRGRLGLAFDGSWEGVLFVFEMLLSACIPAAIFFQARLRSRMPWVGSGAFLAVAGFVLNRLNVSGISMITATGTRYVPSWQEISLSLGVVSGAALVFFFFVENLKVYETPPVVKDPYRIPDPDPLTQVRLGAPWASEARRYSLAFITAAAIAFALLPNGAVHRLEPRSTPVKGPRFVTAWVTPANQGAAADAPSPEAGGLFLHEYALADSGDDPRAGADPVRGLFLLDGNRDTRFVLFDHDAHAERQGREASCRQCHHMNEPLDRATPCFRCHADMYRSTDIFIHSSHVRALGENRACAKCHREPSAVKTERNTTPCLDCHRDMKAQGSLVAPGESDNEHLRRAPGYMEAMHGLCEECHRGKDKETVPAGAPLRLAACTACHKGMDPDVFERQLPRPPDPPAGRVAEVRPPQGPTRDE